MAGIPRGPFGLFYNDGQGRKSKIICEFLTEGDDSDLVRG